MRKRVNPWVVVITAALTFGSLMAFVGPRSSGHYRGHWSHKHGYHQGNGYNRDETCDGNGPHSRNLTPKSDSAEFR
ncbi:hypothetical protein [Spirosoma flavum]|uniref:Uncharacterized protein n=1 Tax=Spirosoma flavum TaxID=2048557 RepID=A0ABW6APB0_9BACT